MTDFDSKISHEIKSPISPICQIIEADMRANSHYPQLDMAKDLAIAATFLKLSLDKKITWREYFSADINNLDEVSHYLEIANKHHFVYGVPLLKRDRLAKLYNKSRNRFKVNTLMSVFELTGESKDYVDKVDNFLCDFKNKAVIECVCKLYTVGYKELNTPSALELAKEYRESIKAFKKERSRPNSNLSSYDYFVLERYWRTFSATIYKMVERSIKTENSSLSFPVKDETLESILKCSSIASRVNIVLFNNQ